MQFMAFPEISHIYPDLLRSQNKSPPVTGGRMYVLSTEKAPLSDGKTAHLSTVRDHFSGESAPAHQILTV
ncbi:MAG: hypothetical protein V8S83_01470 [Oscillospiraceae bacterium]